MTKKQQWNVQTERMSVTLVSEPAAVALRMGGVALPPGIEPPVLPSYLLIARPGGGEPIRIEAEDAALLMWMLTRLTMAHGRMVPTMPAGGDYGLI
jgi:hypothetical protein